MFVNGRHPLDLRVHPRRTAQARIEELAYQRWDGEKIAQEQFFYDPKQFAFRPVPPQA